MLTASKIRSLRIILCFLFFLFSFFSNAQTPGLIVRSTTGPNAVLDYNKDGFTSVSSNGFGVNDVGAENSEIPFKVVPPFKFEPTADLMRGPNDRFTDLVRISDTESGMYVFNDGTNMLFRLRLGEIVPGSKGYSILIDADGLFGASGAYADQNYKPATTGINGNPGFEIEVVLETNFRVAIYDIDGKDDAGNTPSSTYTINTNSQISIAASNVSGTLDYLYDFYVPLADMKYANGTKSVTASTPIRISSTTVMSPQAAIGGPKSDIYGYDGTDYMKAWETIINAQPAFKPSDVTVEGSGISTSLCTTAPVLNSPIGTGIVSVSGKWVQADVTRPSSATITLYINGAAWPTTATVNTGGNWSIPNVSIAPADIIYAKAQATTGESSCLQSNSVIALACLPSSKSSVSNITVICGSDRGFDGTAPENAVVRIYTVTSTGHTLFADQTSTAYKVNRPGTTTRWTYDNVNTNSADPCKGGSADVPIGTYAITIQEPGKCESDYYYFNNSNTTCASTGTPTITQTGLIPGSTKVTGTAVAGANVRLFINGLFHSATTASGGVYSFTTNALSIGDVIDVYALATGSCISVKATYTITCFAAPPILTTNSTGNLVNGTIISGTSGEPVGSTIRLYNSSNTLLATVTVQNGGTWTTNVSAATGTLYYATAQNGGCGVSTASATVATLATTTICPKITGTYNEASASVSGTLSAAFSGTVRLYQDGTFAGSVVVDNATNWTISPAANTLYPGGVLTATTHSSIGAEKTDCSGSVTISCAPPNAPSLTSTIGILSSGDGKVVFKVNSSQSGVLYTLEDVSGVDKSISVFGTGGEISVTSNTFLTPGTYNLRISAIKLFGSSCSSTNTAVTLIVTDNDGDNVADPVDIDDDNDGILDANETTSGDATGDADNDGIPNFKDADFCTLNSNNVCASLDLDRDGIIDQFDLDADNDGIPDLIENGSTDSDNDGKVDGTTDVDGDGLRDAVDANTSASSGSNGITILNFDNDSVANYKDLDSDGDGILDAKESGIKGDTNYSDINGDGWSDVVDGLLSLSLTNTDHTGRANFLDIDADDDGITDNVESQASLPDPGAYIAPAGNDADRDGIDDAYDNDNVVFGGNTDNGIRSIDTNNDNEPDYVDLDSDGDNDKDIIEGNDLNSNGKADDDAKLSNADTDGDGLDDFFETDVNNGPVVTIAGFINGTAGGKSPAQRTAGALGVNRDWRNTSFSLTVNTALPVQFVSFIATKQSNGVQLTWNVTAEENVKNYEVERSTDGRRFSKAGQVSYKVSSNVINKYQFFDATIPASISFYRIRQVDLDGKFMYSAVVTVTNGEAATKLSVHPNPVHNQASIVLGVKSNQKTILMVSDMQGRILNRWQVELQKGQNVITADTCKQLPRGSFIMIAEVDGLLLQTKFIKQ